MEQVTANPPSAKTDTKAKSSSADAHALEGNLRQLLVDSKEASGESAPGEVIDRTLPRRGAERAPVERERGVARRQPGRWRRRPLDLAHAAGTVDGRPGRVSTMILTPVEASASSLEISAAPRIASLTDRFEILGKGFCGDADANQVDIAGHGALVLASSPIALTVLPPMELEPGPATVAVSCAKKDAPAFSTTFVELELKADSSPLKRGEHRTLTVRVHGTAEKISLEARSLAPDVAELVGGDPARRLSSGGEEENIAQFEVVGKKDGTFLISIRLVPTMTRPQRTS